MERKLRTKEGEIISVKMGDKIRISKKHDIVKDGITTHYGEFIAYGTIVQINELKDDMEIMIKGAGWVVQWDHKDYGLVHNEVGGETRTSVGVFGINVNNSTYFDRVELLI